MGRRKQDPLLQAAQGFPGRRKKAVEREINAAANAAEAERVVDSNPFPLPAILARAPAYWRRAIQLWEQQADVLRAGGRRRPGYRAALTRFCIWSQIYEAAAETLRKDLPKGGLTITWQMGHGGTKVVPHPSLDIMKDAEGVLRLLEAEFGFTPRGDSDLTRVETFNAGQGRQPYLPGMSPPSATPPQDDLDPSDLMNQTDSVPPSQSVN